MNYKREQQISNEELQSFRQIEINKIIAKTETKFNKGLLLKGFMSVMLSGALVLVLLGVLLSPDNSSILPVDPSDPTIVNPEEPMSEKEEDYEYKNGESPYHHDINVDSQYDDTVIPVFEPKLLVTEVTPTLFQAYVETEDFELEFTYDAHIVYEGTRQALNDEFDLYQRYVYAPLEVQNQIDITFDMIQADNYRYFLDVSVNGEHSYTQVSYFAPHNGYTISGLETALDFEDFETDIEVLFHLIEKYPPVFKEDIYGIPKYDINPAITEVADARMVSNYTEYVTRFYYEESYNGTEFDKTIQYMQLDTIVLLNEANEIVSRSNSFSSSDNEIVNSNVVGKSFAIIPTGLDTIGKSWTTFTDDETSFTSNFVKINHNEKRYGYLVIPTQNTTVDLSTVTNIQYDYNYPSWMEGSENDYTVLFDAVFFEGNIVTEPLELPINESGYEIIHTIHITLLDELGNVVYEYDSWI